MELTACQDKATHVLVLLSAGLRDGCRVCLHVYTYSGNPASLDSTFWASVNCVVCCLLRISLTWRDEQKELKRDILISCLMSRPGIKSAKAVLLWNSKLGNNFCCWCYRSFANWLARSILSYQWNMTLPCSNNVAVIYRCASRKSWGH